MGPRILVVEDDASLRETLTMGFARAGFSTAGVADGSAALQAFGREPFDAVVLDLMIPSVDGFQVCKQISLISAVPVIILTARQTPSDAVAGLEVGAVDFVRKPFHMGELIARIRAAIRKGDQDHSRAITLGSIRIDVDQHLVTRDGEPVNLTPTEFRLLVTLASRPGRVVPREGLLRAVWGLDHMGDPALTTTIKRLRDKLGPDGDRIIVTVRGVGYKLCCN